MKESDYWKFKIFEHNLTLASDNTPCADMNFTLYERTEVHKILSLSVAIDFYTFNKSTTV